MLPIDNIPKNEAQARELAPLVKADPEAAALTSAYRAPVRLVRPPRSRRCGRRDRLVHPLARVWAGQRW